MTADYPVKDGNGEVIISLQESGYTKDDIYEFTFTTDGVTTYWDLPFKPFFTFLHLDDTFVARSGYVIDFDTQRIVFASPPVGGQSGVLDMFKAIDFGDILPSSMLDTDPDMTADSDVRIPSQKAVRAYVAANVPSPTITLQGEVTGTGAGTINTTIANDSVTFAKMQNISTARLLGRTTAASGNPEEISLNATLSFSGSTLQRAAISGDITIAAGSNTAAITAGVIVNADINASAAIALSKLATQAARSVVVNATNATAVPTALQLAARTLLGCNSGGTALGAITLNGPNMSGTTLSAIGGTVGTTDRRIPVANGTGGQTLQASGVAIDANNNIGTAQTFTQEINTAQNNTDTNLVLIRSKKGKRKVLDDQWDGDASSPVVLDKPAFTFETGTVFSIKYKAIMMSEGTGDKEFYVEGVCTGHVTNKGIHTVDDDQTLFSVDTFGLGASFSMQANGGSNAIVPRVFSNEPKATIHWMMSFDSISVAK
jgi:hypothetical protein